MKRRELILAALGALLLAVGAWKSITFPVVVRETTILADGCRTPATILKASQLKQSGAAIVIHGLSANRRIMLWIGEQLTNSGLRVYLIDLPGHGDSKDHFSFGRAEQCATEAVESLATRGEIQPDKTVLVGHSMGAAIAVRMADRFPVVATVAISSGPMVLPKRMPSNLLVFSAQYDLPLLKREASELAQAAGGDRTNWQDFQQRRAFDLVYVPHASHTSLLRDSRIARSTRLWILHALSPSSLQPEGTDLTSEMNPKRPSGREEPRLAPLLGLCGLLLVFPLAVSILTAAFGAGGKNTPASASGLPANDTLLRWVIAALLAVCVLNFVVPLRPLHMLTADYLASLLLLVAIVVWLLSPQVANASLDFSPRPMFMALLLGLATMLTFGGWLNWQITDAWLNGPRWLRFVFLVPLCWPYFFVEEAALGAPPEFAQRGRRAVRFGFFLLLRLVLWLACIFAYYAFTSGQILVLIMALYLAAISILQRLGCDSVRRRTGSATAAAAFGAILAAWFLAAVFPLT